MSAIRDVILRVRTQHGEAVAGTRAMGSALGTVHSRLATVNTRWMVMKTHISGVASGILSLKGLIVGLAVGRVAGFFKNTIELLGQQEAAERRLAHAMKLSGEFTQAKHQELLNLANALQEVTVHSNDTTVGAMSLLATFGMTADEISRLIPLAQDMADATGRDLQPIVEALGRAYAGQTGSLSRYGLVVDQAQMSAKGFTHILEMLEERFMGVSKQVGVTAYGAMVKLNNAWGDMKKEIALTIIETGAFDRILSGVRGLMNTFKEEMTKNPEFLSNIFNLAVSAMNIVVKILPSIISLFSHLAANAEMYLRIFLILKAAKAGFMMGGPKGALIGAAAGAVIGETIISGARSRITEGQREMKLQVENNFSIDGASAEQVAREIDRGKRVVERKLQEPLREMTATQRNQYNYRSAGI